MLNEIEQIVGFDKQDQVIEQEQDNKIEEHGGLGDGLEIVEEVKEGAEDEQEGEEDHTYPSSAVIVVKQTSVDPMVEKTNENN